MTKRTVSALILAVCLIVIGSALFIGVMYMMEWDFMKLETTKYQTTEHTIDADFQNISIRSDVSDIALLPSENGKAYAVCYEPKNMSHSVRVTEDTLVIECLDTRKWYEHIQIGFHTAKVSLYLPAETWNTLSVTATTGNITIDKHFSFQKIDLQVTTGDIHNYASSETTLSAETTTGDIEIANITADTVALHANTGFISATAITCRDLDTSVTTGKTTLSDIHCSNLRSQGTTGSVTAKNVICSEVLSIERSTGSIQFDRCDAGKLDVITSTGNIKGSLLTDKIFFAHTDTGRIRVPKTTTGGTCEIRTDTGDIIITVESSAS